QSRSTSLLLPALSFRSCMVVPAADGAPPRLDQRQRSHTLTSAAEAPIFRTISARWRRERMTSGAAATVPSAPPARMNMVEISVVIPVYGCADCLPTLHRRLVQTLAQLNSSYEIVFVDDRSSDGSWEAMSELAAADPAVKAVRLSR